MRGAGALVAYSNKKNLLVILKTCEGVEKLLSPEGEKEFLSFVGKLLQRVENPLEVLEHYREIKHLFRELKEKLGIEKAGVLIYDIENSYPLSDEEGIERLTSLIESETIWEKPVLAYSRCLEDTPIVKIYDMDKKEAYEPLAA